MREELVGYFLGALDRDAAEHVEKKLSENPALREDLDRIGWAMRPLAADPDLEPPHGLAERTVRRVMWLRRPEPWCAAPTTQWRLTDLAIAASILLAMSVIILPALNESRQQRSIVECSHNMRNLGVALESYAEKHGNYLPFYSNSGPLAVAGIYAPILLESQFVSDRSMFVCPSTGDSAAAIPTLSEMRLAQHDIAKLSSLVRSAGGSYGSLLGFMEDGVYRASRIDRLAGQSLLVDSPSRSADGNLRHSNSPNHEGRGQNALCRDGSVRFFSHPKECPECDFFYVSLGNRVEPGWNPSDLVFGSSEARIGEDSEQF